MRTAFVILLLCGAAAAEPVVLAVDKGTIYVELGARDGVGAGTELELLHVVTVKDPRTGQTLRDQFALGTLDVVKSGDHVSVAHAEGELAKRVLAGDRVRIASAVRTFRDPWQDQVLASRGTSAPVAAPGTSPASPSRPNVDHVELVRAAWFETLGKPPDTRVTRWLELLRIDPQTPYRTAVQQEIKSLQGQVATRDVALAKARSERTDDRAPRIARLAAAVSNSDAWLVVTQLDRVAPGRPIQLGFLVRTPGLAHAFLYVKPPGEPGFRRSELRPDGDAYLRGTIDAATVRAPGIDWYVEAATDHGETRPVIGNRTEPNHIIVEDVVDEAPIAENRSHIDAHIDYVDFDGKLNKGFDQYYQAEADFTYRFLHPVHAVRLGFGTLSGTGGPKNVIDASTNCTDMTGAFRCRNVSFSYVYTEFELRIRRNIAVMLRPQAGLLTTDTQMGSDNSRCAGRDINNCQFFTGLGFRGRLRLGDENATHLVLGAGFTDNIGTLLEAAYHWLPAKTVPVQLTVQVTDLPVPEDFGVRLIGDVGYRTDWFYPSLRLSYQARDIDHAGVSGGLALNFDW